jgi:hypothetical protein
MEHLADQFEIFSGYRVLVLPAQMALAVG